MCAINGFNFKDEDLVLKMNRTTYHRGPDSSGIFLDNNISLGHNRLSIIDPNTTANQPMESDNGNFVVVFNGEIYNFKELKEELKDYPFKTKSDTEVILASYKKWGKECVKKLNGIFAFAIWDKQKKELFLARDHIGVKPLYYFCDGERFIFSSEIKAILEHNIPRVLNKEAFNHYLRILYTPEPLTMFEGIYKLPPACIATFKDKKLSIENYWEVENTEYLKLSKKEIAERLKIQIINSVEKQLISDKPLGIYLSGGIDSSVVLDCVSSVRKNVDTFSVGFELSGKEESDKFNEDFNLARETAEFYRTNHNEVLLKYDDVLDLLEKTIWHCDEPISNPTAISMAKLANFAKDKVDVVLGGDGGDELFGGYERYRLSLLSSYYRKLPSPLRNFLSHSEKFKKLNTPEGIERFSLFMFQKNNILKRVISENFLDIKISYEFFHNKYLNKSKSGSFEEIFMDTDRRSWLPDQSLSLSDKMSMSYGLEARVPLLDKELVEFAVKIPLKYKVNLFNTKIILKEAFRKDIPEFLFKQPKRGWFSPGAKWLRHPKIYKMACDILSENYYNETQELFNWREVRKVLEDHCSKKEYNLTIIWALMTFQIWAKNYKVKI